MVGGLADWFAVTALFRYPLGLPIPHTAIIPRKKDQIGAALGTFVHQNFLTPSVVGERLAAAQIPRRAGEWLAQPAHAARIADEASAALNGLAAMIRDDEVRAAVAQYADKRLRDVQLAAILATRPGRGARVRSAPSGADRGAQGPDALPRRQPGRLPRPALAGVARVGTGLGRRTPVQPAVRRAAVLPRGRERARRSRTAQPVRPGAARLRARTAHGPEQAARVEAAKVELLERDDVRGWLSRPVAAHQESDPGRGGGPRLGAAADDPVGDDAARRQPA